VRLVKRIVDWIGICRLRVISVTLKSAGMVPARMESAPVSAVRNDLEMMTLKLSLNRSKFFSALFRPDHGLPDRTTK